MTTRFEGGILLVVEAHGVQAWKDVSSLDISEKTIGIEH
jgi:hypothetical protein